jgi:hypothetical protein
MTPVPERNTPYIVPSEIYIKIHARSPDPNGNGNYGKSRNDLYDVYVFQSIDPSLSPRQNIEHVIPRGRFDVRCEDSVSDFLTQIREGIEKVLKDSSSRFK